MNIFDRLGLSLTVVCALLPTVCEGSTIERLSFVELARQADLIVQASVETGSSRLEIRDEIPWTCITLRVTKNLKGNTGPTLETCFLGGVVGTRVSAVSGQRLPGEGKAGFFFLTDPKKGYINPLVGWSQGIFYVSTDSAGREFITTATGGIVSTINLSPSSQADGFEQEAVRGVSTAPQAAGRPPITPSAFIDLVHNALIAPR